MFCGRKGSGFPFQLQLSFLSIFPYKILWVVHNTEKKYLSALVEVVGKNFSYLSSSAGLTRCSRLKDYLRKKKEWWTAGNSRHQLQVMFLKHSIFLLSLINNSFMILVAVYVFVNEILIRLYNFCFTQEICWFMHDPSYIISSWWLYIFFVSLLINSKGIISGDIHFSEWVRIRAVCV